MNVGISEWADWAQMRALLAARTVASMGESLDSESAAGLLGLSCGAFRTLAETGDITLSSNSRFVIEENLDIVVELFRRRAPLPRPEWVLPARSHLMLELPSLSIAGLKSISEARGRSLEGIIELIIAGPAD